MKITEIRTRVVEWRGKTVPPQPHFCTNPMDLLDLPADSMGSFRFHGWLIVEVFTDAGLVGIGNAALSPRVTKQLIDLYLKPLLIGKDPFDSEFLWQHMYRQTMAFGRKGVAMVAISAVDIAIWDLLGKAAKQPVFKLLGGRTKRTIPVYASRLYSQPLEQLAAEAAAYKTAGLPRHEAALRLGPARRRRRHAAQRGTGAHGARGDRLRTRPDGRRLHGLDARLRAPHAAAARTVPTALARGAGDPGRSSAAMPRSRQPAASPSPAASTSIPSTASGRLLEAGAVDYIQFDTNRVGGITQARKVQALAESYSVPVVPHAGQMHNFHVVMASLNSPMAEFFPVVDVEIGNELFWYIFEGEPTPVNGEIDLRDDVPGLGISIREGDLKNFAVIE